MGEVDRGLAVQWRIDERERAAKLVEAERDGLVRIGNAAPPGSAEHRLCLAIARHMTRLAKQIRSGEDDDSVG